MNSLRGQITDVLQRVKYVKLGGDLDPLAGDILALIAEAMLSEEVVERAASALLAASQRRIGFAPEQCKSLGELPPDVRKDYIDDARAALTAAGITQEGASDA